MHVERIGSDQVIFGRVRNRVDLIGKVVKVNGKFVCLDIPNFKGYLEYPSTLVEFMEDFEFSDQRKSQP